jgi:hypothetical protein
MGNGQGVVCLAEELDERRKRDIHFFKKYFGIAMVTEGTVLENFLWWRVQIAELEVIETAWYGQIGGGRI